MNDKKENLRSFNDMTVKEQRKIQSMGGKASVAARRERQAFRDLAKALLDCDAAEDEAQLLKSIGFGEESGHTQKALIMLGLVKAAKKGDVKAFDKIEELCGESVPSVSEAALQEELLRVIRQAVEKGRD